MYVMYISTSTHTHLYQIKISFDIKKCFQNCITSNLKFSYKCVGASELVSIINIIDDMKMHHMGNHL